MTVNKFRARQFKEARERIHERPGEDFQNMADNPLDRPDPEHPADEEGPDEQDIPQGPYDKLPPREPMRRPGFVGGRRDSTRTRIPYRRILPHLRGRR